MEIGDIYKLIVCEPTEFGAYAAFIPGIPGAIAESATVDEAKRLAIEELYELLHLHRRQ